jgi:2-amino-4-hydroxy-6-hydroxymethyldihydropteridine diphosphokinase
VTGKPDIAFLSLGANMGDKRAAIERAADLIAALPRTRVVARSRSWRTPPWGKTDQDWFVNAALKIETSLAPLDLLDACLGVERRMGRERIEKWGPRLIDVDIIAYGDVAVTGGRLTLPHPHVLERAFVLAPLADIAPHLALGGRPIRDALAGLDTTGIAPLPDPLEPAEDPPFNHSFADGPGTLARLSPLVRRMVAGNPGPFTFTGTCTYVVGNGEVAVIDPGPADASHIDALIAALGRETVTHIVVTHTHRDHSPGAKLLAARTGAPVIGCDVHRSFRPLHEGEAGTEAGGDRDYRPARVLEDGEVFEGKGFTLEAVHTPGHTANHLAFALREENALFSGDHVMAWSTTVVAPPDGSMRDFMLSLDRLKGRDETIYWPGHGGPVNEPRRFVRALINHRRMRESAILNRLSLGDETIEAIVEAIYVGLDPRLKGGAARSVFAHLEDLVERGLIVSDGPATLSGRFAPK